MVNDSLSEIYIYITVPHFIECSRPRLGADKYLLSRLIDFESQIRMSAVLIQRIPQFSGNLGHISPHFSGQRAATPAPFLPGGRERRRTSRRISVVLPYSLDDRRSSCRAEPYFPAFPPQNAVGVRLLRSMGGYARRLVNRAVRTLV